VDRSGGKLVLIRFASLPFPGCGMAAAPCRITSAVIDMVPVVGRTAATLTDSCAEAIDPQ
jgi:hypothetical protein